MITATTRIILASQSKMRRRALDILGLTYECIPANIDEKAIRDADPLKMAIKISEAKARTVAMHQDGIIIASDAFLFFDGKVLEKPHSLAEAHAMLRALSDKTHRFITGLAVYDTQTKIMRSGVATCSITLRTLSDDEINDYCNRYPVLSLAGALEIDGVMRFSERIDGACNFVTAMPIQLLVQLLGEIE